MADKPKRRPAAAAGRKPVASKDRPAGNPVTKRQGAGKSAHKSTARKRRITAGSKRTCILVLGMHRSGTSALTRVVSLMGATLPKRLMGAGGGNEAGHWEPERLVAYHDQMLAELGSAWHDFKPLDLKAVSVSRREAMKADIREILEEDYGDAPLIVVKDPRICRFAPFFSQAAGEAGYDVATVLTFRNPLEVIDSLIARRDNWPKTYDTQDAALLWLVHNLEAERASREFPRAVVSYDGLIGDWKKPVSAIAAALENPFANALDDVEAEVSAFIDERQRHHTKRQEDVLLDPRTAGWVSDCYSALRALEAGRNVEKAKAELDRVHAEFITTLPVLQQTVEARRKTAQEKQVLDERLARVEAEAEEKERILAEHANVLERERDGSHGRVQSLTAEVAQAKKKIAQLECEASQARARRDAAAEDAARDREKARAAEARFSQAQAEIADLRREIAAREKLLADERQTAAKLHEQLTAELETERAERQAREQQAVSLQAMLAEERSQGEARIAELEKMAAEKDAKIGDLERDGQESQAHITGLQQEVEEKTGRIAGLERDAAANADLISGLKQEVEEKTGRIAGLERDVEHRSREARAAHTRLQQVTQEFKNSTSWKLTAPLRAVKAGPRALARIARVTPAAIRVGGGVVPTIGKVVKAWKQDGLKGVFSRASDIANVPDAAQFVPAASLTNLDPLEDKLAKDCETIKASGLFDKVWLEQQCGMSFSSENEAIRNYIKEERLHKFDPSPNFISNAYIGANRLNRGENPLYHYLTNNKVNRNINQKLDGKIAVYTANIREYDNLNNPLTPSKNVKYFVFSDTERKKIGVWDVIKPDYFNSSPTRSARFYKLHPHFYFQEYDYSIWIDSNLTMCVTPEDLINSVEGNKGLAIWRHPLRDCIFDEARECIRLGKDEPEIIEQQINRYYCEGFPKKFGLWETGAMIRRHNEPEIKELMSLWWREIQNGSKRDQIGLAYALWKSQIAVGSIAPQGICVRSDPRFIYQSHLNKQ